MAVSVIVELVRRDENDKPLLLARNIVSDGALREAARRLDAVQGQLRQG